ncbi:MAG: HAD family hydrolase [Clostridia bacterium]|nr:HAD family hydrolase [Clostridia bacterium]
MIKAVVFDLDHTLFDRNGTLKSLVIALRKEFQVNEKMTDEEIAAEWCYADRTFVYSGWEYIFGYLKEKGVLLGSPDFQDYCEFLYKYFELISVPFPETVPMLEKLRGLGYKTGLITNGNHKLQYAKIRNLELSGHFDEIIVTGDYGIHKPDREIFDIMREKLGFSADEIVYVGDNPVNDIEGARNAGWHTIWMKSTGFWLDEIEKAEREVFTVSEVIDAVLSLEE